MPPIRNKPTATESSKAKQQGKEKPITRRRQSNDTHSRIVQANHDLLQRLGKLKNWNDRVIDYFKAPLKYGDELTHTCWACGQFNEYCKMTRCHVVANRHGGDDIAANYFLLCDYCHKEQTDEAIRGVQEEWLVDREHHWDRIDRHCSTLYGYLKAAAPTHAHMSALCSFIWLIHTRIFGWAERKSGSKVTQLNIVHMYWKRLAEKWVRNMAHVSQWTVYRHMRKRYPLPSWAALRDVVLEEGEFSPED